MKRNSGFTLIEVMVAMLLGAIGLLGTLAVQQAVIGASKMANDAAVALRLASQKLEEFSTVLTTGAPPPGNLTPPNTDQFQSPVALANAIGDLAWKSANVAYVNAGGVELTTAPTTGAAAAEFRWIRRWRVINLGPARPYVISAVVTYSTDTGSPKTVRLDMERWKSW
jgi:prepilin-type N-terminal cleavage/methylation domain-containing protein